jgi:hypothetical protein
LPRRAHRRNALLAQLRGEQDPRRFEQLAPILAERGTPPEYYQLAGAYGLTIEDEWIEELERTYGVKL